MIIEVTWTRDEVVVNSVEVPEVFRNFSKLSVCLRFQSIILNGMLPRIVSRVVGRAHPHQLYSFDFEE